MRLFTAIEFSDNIKNELERSSQMMRSFCSQGNFTLRENYHLTLVFIGEVPEERTAKIKQAMDEFSGYGSFDVELKELDIFKRREGNILIRKAQCEDHYAKLYRSLSQSLKEKGFFIEDRTPVPHITMARKAVFHDKNALDNMNLLIIPLKQKVSGITLFRSDRINGKLTYTAIYKTIL